jgi:hypothetical protein
VNAETVVANLVLIPLAGVRFPMPPGPFRLVDSIPEPGVAGRGAAEALTVRVEHHDVTPTRSGKSRNARTIRGDEFSDVDGTAPVLPAPNGREVARGRCDLDQARLGSAVTTHRRRRLDGADAYPAEYRRRVGADPPGAAGKARKDGTGRDGAEPRDGLAPPGVVVRDEKTRQQRRGSIP